MSLSGVDGKNIESVDDALSLYENLQSAERRTGSDSKKGTFADHRLLGGVMPERQA